MWNWITILGFYYGLNNEESAGMFFLAALFGIFLYVIVALLKKFTNTLNDMNLPKQSRKDYMPTGMKNITSTPKPRTTKKK